MKHRVAVAALLLLAAASFGINAQQVTVTVTATAGGDITVDPDPVTVTGKGPGVIRFQLQGSGFSFVERTPGGQRGIHIDREVVSATDLRARGEGANQREIGPCERVENGRAMNCPNRHSRAGVFKYTVNLLGPNGQPLKPKDPIIVNQ
jgi:hypothetical protein